MGTYRALFPIPSSLSDVLKNGPVSTVQQGPVERQRPVRCDHWSIVIEGGAGAGFVVQADIWTLSPDPLRASQLRSQSFRRRHARSAAEQKSDR